MAASSEKSYIGMARRYRPQLFTELVGQEQIGHFLAQQVSQNRVAQAYLFSGPRGIGKTSAARILAKSMNCVEGPTATPCGKCPQCQGVISGSSMDVIEIDGASNNKVDDIRNLQETISQNPFAARKKIYIIDEVHMLSTGAFNALLKTLEEPPPFVIFIFATTELEKIPETIKSRCQVLQFNRITLDDLVRRLDYVAEQEGLTVDPAERHEIFETIALAVDGGLRDAMMALDQIAALNEGVLRLDETVRFLGVVEHDMLFRIVELLVSRDTRGLLQIIAQLVERGRDLERFVRNLLGFLRDLMIIKSGGDATLVALGEEKFKRARALLAGEQGGEALGLPQLLNYIQMFVNLEAELKETVQVRILLEFAMVKLTAIEPLMDVGQLLARVEKGGAARPVAAPATPAPLKPTAAAVSPEKQDTNPETPDLFHKGEARPLKPLDAGQLWDALQGNQKRLGLPLHVALSDCQCRGLENDCLVAVISEEKKFSINKIRESARAIEEYLREMAGRPLRFELRVTHREGSSGAPSADQPRRPAAPSTGQGDAVAEKAQVFCDSSLETLDTNELYFRQNPVARIKNALKTNAKLRDQVIMVQRFFDGQIFDPAGGEIIL